MVLVCAEPHDARRSRVSLYVWCQQGAVRSIPKKGQLHDQKSVVGLNSLQAWSLEGLVEGLSVCHRHHYCRAEKQFVGAQTSRPKSGSQGRVCDR